MNNNILEKIKNIVSEKNMFFDEPMSKHTTFKCGGCAALFVIADDIDSLQKLVYLFNTEKQEYMMLGNGSNILFMDNGYDGVVVKLGKEFTEIIMEEDGFICGAASMLPFISRLALAKEFTGFEFACSIPGSLGGGIFMNAGAYGGSLKDVLHTVTAMTRDGDIYVYDADELDLSYRHSRFEESGEIILSAKLKLSKGDPEKIKAKMDENTKSRNEKQPVKYPSAGSFFKRPEGYAAAALIDQAGLKGFKVGGAQVSELHAGFVINADHATAGDILELADKISETVKKKYGVVLTPEVRIAGK